MAVSRLGSGHTRYILAAAALMAVLLFPVILRSQLQASLSRREPRWTIDSTGSLLIPTIEPGSRDIMIQALDYREVFPQVYDPEEYRVCPVTSLQCWLPLTKPLDCKVLFDDYSRVLVAHKPEFPTPKVIPAHQRDTFLLQGYTSLSSHYIPQPDYAPDAEVPSWTLNTIKDFMAKARLRSALGSYGDDAHKLFQALDCHPITGLRGAVFGTQVPWLEAILFTFGAKHILTIEYRKTISQIPDHQIVRPLEWVQGVQSGSMTNVDFAFSYSSWEHDGLGRYGDPIDPWGDIKSMQRASCYVKPGGILYLGVPVSGTDQLQYNAHRIYGPVRLPLMTANWEVLGAYDSSYKVGVCGRPTCENLFARWQQKTQGSVLLHSVIVVRNLRTSPCNLQHGSL